MKNEFCIFLRYDTIEIFCEKYILIIFAQNFQNTVVLMTKKKSKKNGLKAKVAVIVTAIASVAVIACLLHLCYHSKGDKDLWTKGKEKEFYLNDYNDAHLRAATKHGIEPIANREGVDFDAIPQLEKIQDCDLYAVDNLTHSVPYLTHNARLLLERIGQDFQDSLAARGAMKYKVIVTSCLRTLSDVEKLQTVNKNASLRSAHCYATTFDLAHARYVSVSSNGKPISYAEMKTVLGNVLKELRKRRWCYALIEERQSCYHITSRR